MSKQVNLATLCEKWAIQGQDIANSLVDDFIQFEPHEVQVMHLEMAKALREESQRLRNCAVVLRTEQPESGENTRP